MSIFNQGLLNRLLNRQYSFWKGQSFTSAQEIYWPIRVNSTNLKLSFRFADSLSIPDSYTISVREYDLNNGTDVIDHRVIYEGVDEQVNELREVEFKSGSQIIGLVFNDNSGTVEQRNIRFFSLSEQDVNYKEDFDRLINNQYSIFDLSASTNTSSPYVSGELLFKNNKGILLYTPGALVEQIQINLLHIADSEDNVEHDFTQTIFDDEIPFGVTSPLVIPFNSWSNRFRVQIIKNGSFPVKNLEIVEVADFPDNIYDQYPLLLPEQKSEEHLLTADINASTGNTITPNKRYKNAYLENKSSLHPVKFTIDEREYIINPLEGRNISILEGRDSDIIYNSLLGTATVRVLLSDQRIEDNKIGKEQKFEFSNFRAWRVISPRGQSKGEVLLTDSAGLDLYKASIDPNNPDTFSSGPTLLQTFLNPIIDIFVTANKSCLLTTGTIGQSDMRLWKSPSNDWFETTVTEVTIGATSAWFVRTGISESLSSIVFGEYANDGSNASLWRSADDGDTWTEVLAFTTEVKHCHTIEADLYDNGDVFYATFGDSGQECRWYKSENDGVTFSPIADVNAEQSTVYKNLGLVITDSHIIWATDAPGYRNAIYKAPKNDLVNGRKEVCRTNQVFFGVLDANDYLLAHAVTQHGGGPTARGSFFGEIYVSYDMGDTWELINQWECKGAVGNGGFRFSTLPSVNGVVYLSTDRSALEGHFLNANTLRLKSKNF